jgi:hypothetical protein
MNTRTLSRRLRNLERRLGALAPALTITVIFVGPDGACEEDFTFRVGGDNPSDQNRSRQNASGCPR